LDGASRPSSRYLPLTNDPAVSVGAGKYMIQVLWGSQSYVMTNGPEWVFTKYDYLVRLVALTMIFIMTFMHAVVPKIAIKTQDVFTTVKALILVLISLIGFIAAFGWIETAPNNNFTDSFVNSNYDINVIINSFFKVLFVYDGKYCAINFRMGEFELFSFGIERSFA
jgi:amino acid transporter